MLNSVLDKNQHQPLRAAASPRSEVHALHRAEWVLLLCSLQGAAGLALEEAVLQGAVLCVCSGGSCAAPCGT